MVGRYRPDYALSHFRIFSLEAGPLFTIGFPSSSSRFYTLFYSSALTAAPNSPPTWSPVPGQTDIPGTGGLDLLTDTNAAPHKFYRVGVKMR